jgi:lysozyme
VTAADRARWGTISRERGLALLAEDGRDAARAVEWGVRVPLSQEQFDALVSFVFNVGVGAFASSTLLRKLNAGDRHGAADEMLRWSRAGGRVLEGRLRRRRAERALFLSAAASPHAVLTARERRLVSEYDRLVARGLNRARRRQLREAMTAQRKRIWRAAQGVGMGTAPSARAVPGAASADTVIAQHSHRCGCQTHSKSVGRGCIGSRTVKASGLPAAIRAGIEVVSIDPYDAYRPGDPCRAAARKYRVRSLPARARRQRRAGCGAPRTPAPSKGSASQARAALASTPRGATSSTARATSCSRPANACASVSAGRGSELFERDPILAEARGLKETFRDVYRANHRVEAERRVEGFLAAVDRAGLPAFDAFAKGIRLWRRELLAYIDEQTTNGYAEGVINKVKVIKRRAYGIPTFTAFRQRVLRACGRGDHAASPRSIEEAPIIQPAATREVTPRALSVAGWRLPRDLKRVAIALVDIR